MAEDYCDLCDLPLSTCIHGMPPPPPKPPPAPRRTVTTRTTGSAPTRTTSARPPSRSTDRSQFRPHIVAVLREAGGRMDQDDVMLELEIRMDDVLKDRDREPSPTGELRWRTAARAERKAMMDEGLMVAAQPGVWELVQRPPTGT